MLTPLVMIVCGFVFLWKGADYLVEGAIDLAHRFHIPDIIIGLTVIAFGTSLPELIVNVIASVEKQPDIIVGNILGSNLANLLLILGASGIFAVLSVSSAILTIEVPIALASSIVLFPMFLLPDSGNQWMIGRVDGLILLLGFGLFLWLLLNKKLGPKKSDTAHLSVPKTITYISLGIILLPLGGILAIDGSTQLGTAMGISQAFMGLFTLALGTSLPELVTAISAGIKKRPEMIIGNVIGSNIFNILLVLGVSALIRPIPVQSMFILEISLISAVTLMLYLFVKTGRRNQLDRWEAALLLAGYALYIAFIYARG